MPQAVAVRSTTRRRTCYDQAPIRKGKIIRLGVPVISMKGALQVTFKLLIWRSKASWCEGPPGQMHGETACISFPSTSDLSLTLLPDPICPSGTRKKHPLPAPHPPRNSTNVTFCKNLTGFKMTSEAFTLSPTRDGEHQSYSAFPGEADFSMARDWERHLLHRIFHFIGSAPTKSAKHCYYGPSARTRKQPCYIKGLV